MNTKTFKRIITIVELVLIGIIFLCFAGTCLNIDPIKGLDLDNMKYDGYHAFFGYGSEFDTSVGSVAIAILLGIVGALGIVSLIFPKISVIFNSIIAILAIFAGVFIFFNVYILVVLYESLNTLFSPIVPNGTILNVYFSLLTSKWYSKLLWFLLGMCLDNDS